MSKHMREDSLKIVGRLYSLGYDQNDFKNDLKFDFVSLAISALSEDRTKIWIEHGLAEQINEIYFLNKRGLRRILGLAYS